MMGFLSDDGGSAGGLSHSRRRVTGEGTQRRPISDFAFSARSSLNLARVPALASAKAFLFLLTCFKTVHAAKPIGLKLSSVTCVLPPALLPSKVIKHGSFRCFPKNLRSGAVRQ